MKKLRITLEGKSYDVTVEVLDEATVMHSPILPAAAKPLTTALPAAAAAPPVAVSGDGRIVASPMAGLIFKCLVKPGDVVTFNQVVIVLDAMKMETPVYAPVAGTITAVFVKEGDAVDEGHSLLQIDGGPK